MDRLDMLRTFVAVAERSSFAEAARRLRMSPAATSRAVASLERTLGTPLLRRTTRSVALTEQGALYLERCRHALSELEEAAHELRTAEAQPGGSLVVTAPVVFGRLHVLPVIARLLREHPKLHVRLMLIDRVVMIVEEGIDVAVRIAELPDSGLHATKVGEVQRVLVASPAYLAARGTPDSVAQLPEHDLIAFEGITPNNEWRFGASGRPVLRFEPRLVVNTADAAIAACAGGLGITRVLSYQVASHVAAGELQLVLQEQAPPPVPVNLVYPANRNRAPNVRAFLTVAREYFRTKPISSAAMLRQRP
jgi:DNA-binding transcriptional LysR family regulator